MKTATPESVDESGNKDRLRQQVRTASRWLDSAWVVPGTRFSFGIDAIIGLVPVAGDLFSAAMSGWLIWSATRLGAPANLVGRMVGNIALDLLVGLIPLVGDVADVAFRANLRNLRIIEAWLESDQKPPGRSRLWLLSLAVLLLLAVLVLLAMGFAQMLNLLILRQPV